MARRRNNKEFPVYGVSPLGGNSVEATGPINAPITVTDVEAVPLLWDARVGGYISELAKMELDDRDISLAQAKLYNEDAEFRARAGYIQT